MAAWIRRVDTRLLDGSRDEIVRSEFVPSEELPVGEVRLVRREPAVVMQTVLDTMFLKRVVAEIRKKDVADWPISRDGHDDAMKYIEAIQSANAGIQERFRHREHRGDRRQRMPIGFIHSRNASIVAIAEPSLTEAGGHMRVVSRRQIAVLPLSRVDVRDLLEPMLPPESP